VPDHVDPRQVLDGPGQVGSDDVAAGLIVHAHQARPQGSAGGLLGHQRRGADEPVRVPGLPVPEPDAMQHAVTVDRVQVPADRREPRVRAVADVVPVDLGRQLAVDPQAVDVDLGC
jgi:hypothetical protein